MGGPVRGSPGPGLPRVGRQHRGARLHGRVVDRSGIGHGLAHAHRVGRVRRPSQGHKPGDGGGVHQPEGLRLRPQEPGGARGFQETSNRDVDGRQQLGVRSRKPAGRS